MNEGFNKSQRSAVVRPDLNKARITIRLKAACLLIIQR